jgi:Ca2+-binding RTX toxin-like protein
MFEHLEARRLFAGSPIPTASVIGSTLVVTGGTKTDNVTVSEDSASVVTVSYVDSTNTNHVIYTGAAAATPEVTVDTLGKNDKINVFLDHPHFIARGAGGDDQIVIGGQHINGGSASGDAGNDTITVLATDDTRPAGAVQVSGGDGNDNISLTDTGPINTGGSSVDGGKGKDKITIDNANNTIVSGGADNDTIIINTAAFASGTGHLAAQVDAGAGNDYIVLVHGDNSVNGNSGTDTLELHTSTGATTLYGQISIETVIIA